MVWREIWPDIAPVLNQVMAHNEGTYVDSQLLIMQRIGIPATALPLAPALAPAEERRGPDG